MAGINQYGQTMLDPRAELLLGRATRQEPIMGGMNLLGRLAALGAGQARQRSFEDEIAQSRLQYATALQGAGSDPNARLAALGAGLASKDPMIRMSAAEQMATLVTPETKFIAGPNGSQYAATTQGGKLVSPPQQIIAGERKAPGIESVPVGEEQVAMQWDPQANAYVPIARAPRNALDRGLTDEAASQRMAISAAGASSVNVMNPTGPAAAIASVDLLMQQGLLPPDIATQIRNGLVAKAAETPQQAREAAAAIAAETKDKDEAKRLKDAESAVSTYRAAVDAWRGNRANAAAIAKLGAAQERVVQALAAKRSAPRAPTDSDVEQARTSIPDPLTLIQAAGAAQGVDPFASALAVTEQELGITTPAAAAPPGAPGANMTPAELRRLAELKEKAQRGAK